MKGSTVEKPLGGGARASRPCIATLFVASFNCTRFASRKPDSIGIRGSQDNRYMNAEVVSMAKVCEANNDEEANMFGQNERRRVTAGIGG